MSLNERIITIFNSRNTLEVSKTDMRSLLIIITFFGLNTVNAQKIVDTVVTDQGTMLIYANRTWEYEADQNFDGVMNSRLYDEVFMDSSLNYIQGWNHDMCYTSDLANDVNKLNKLFNDGEAELTALEKITLFGSLR